ncbi:MAG TPA: ADP-ribosylglycohydrolase family protein [Phycisphaerae bacterium]|nr:ADP-ribosylglycohydrolase family protein [Phycisphaerae bacterium]HRR86040.1 ADP-ribosylglycohydrolase family protein [Phycisphaerae bacterium]
MMTVSREVYVGALAGLLLATSGCSLESSKTGNARFSDAELLRAGRLTNNEKLYFDKVHGAWSGKLIGLILGQPTEGWGREQIETKAREAGCYPITAYMPAAFDTPHKGFLAGNFDSSPPNDDSDLMLVALLAVRERGIHLTARDLAECWLKYVPSACTAELVALENFKRNIWPPESATTGNPYAEWIGAQMRVDVWGMIAPGMPRLAAEYATMDASLSHADNGIYAARFIAAAVSLAMVENDVNTVVRRSLELIPADCRYAEAIRDAVAWNRRYSNWQAAWEQLDRKYGFDPDGTRGDQFAEEQYNTGEAPYLWGNWRWVYADVNGAACALALLYGRGDFSRSICLAAMMGYDNDCNSGTVGAILGAMHGHSAIPEQWKKPLNDTYQTGLNLAERRLKISELAKETAGYGRQLVRSCREKRSSRQEHRTAAGTAGSDSSCAGFALPPGI